MHWDNAWWEVKSDQQELAEELNWDVLGFLSDYINDDITDLDPRINEDFIVYIYEAACCDELQTTREHLLEAYSFTQDELRDYEEAHHTDAITIAKNTAYAACGM